MEFDGGGKQRKENVGASGASDRTYSREIVVEIFAFVGTIRPKIGMSTVNVRECRKGSQQEQEWKEVCCDKL